MFTISRCYLLIDIYRANGPFVIAKARISISRQLEDIYCPLFRITFDIHVRACEGEDNHGENYSNFN